VAVLVVYVLSLIGVHLLAISSPPLLAVDLSQFHKEDTIVQLSLEELKPVANRLSVNVLVYPEDNLYDQNMGVLTSDAAVRLYPDNDLGDLQYPKGKAPAQVSTKIEAHGDPGNWPFDNYTTGELSALVFTGGYHDKVWARMEVTGSLDGWDVSVKRVHDAEDTENPNSLDNVIITLHRSKGPLICDLGLCLILVALPALALMVAIPMALGRTSQLLARLPAARLVGRPSRRAVGVDSAGRRDVPVRRRVGSATGSKGSEGEKDLSGATPNSVPPES